MPKELIDLLEKREFISVATCDFKGPPNAASKFVFKVEGRKVYLADYTMGRTWDNLNVNPVISISFLDPRTLKGYRLNGSARIIDKGPGYKKMCKEMVEKEIVLTAQHIIEDLRKETKHDNFEVMISEKIAIFEVLVDEVAEFGPEGGITRKKL